MLCKELPEWFGIGMIVAFHYHNVSRTGRVIAIYENSFKIEYNRIDTSSGQRGYSTCSLDKVESLRKFIIQDK